MAGDPLDSFRPFEAHGRRGRILGPIPDERETLRDHFREVSDLERLAGRVGCGTAKARDLVALRNTLALLPKLHQMLSGFKAQWIREKVQAWDNLKEVHKLVEKSIADEPPLALKEGGLIKAAYSPELDELKKGSLEGKAWIAQLEEKEKNRTGISSLKVRYTSVFGYYIEVSKANLDKVPQDYHRKQTLVNAERFITQELKEMEGKVLGAQEKADRMEYEIFDEIRSEVGKEIAPASAQWRNAWRSWIFFPPWRAFSRRPGTLTAPLRSMTPPRW